MMNKAIRNIFSEVPETYELVNHILTGCLDILWRRRAVKFAVQAGGTRWIDVCTGTGETASYLCSLANKETDVYAADFSFPMLKKATEKPEASSIKFLLSDVNNLPFPDEAFDLITISFATRNINLSRDTLIGTFKEFHRILREGGHFINLETSQPSSSLVRKVLHKYANWFVMPIGSRVSGSKSGYAYLANTIPRFYPAEELKGIMSQAGFKDIRVKTLMFGVAAIHQGIKY
jgi:demethylmenaquinone methyltransferase/2-methoxy-6-polyprenyl-1,4-benzoquinol methylase